MYVLGLHLDGNYFKVCLLSKKGGVIHIEFLKEFNKEIANLEKLKKNLNSKGWFRPPSLEVISALPQEEVYLRKFEVPYTRKRDVYKAIESELSFEEGGSEENYIHLPKLATCKTKTKVTLYSYLRKSLINHHQFIEGLGIDPENVTSVEQAFERFGAFCNVKQAPYLHFHLGWESSSFYYFNEGSLVEGAYFSFGFKDVIDAVQKDHLLLEEVEIEQVHSLYLKTLEAGKDGAIKESFTTLRNSLLRVFSFIEKDHVMADPHKVLFTGYAEFARAVKGKIEEINKEEFIPGHKEYSPLQLSAFAIEIGLALELVERGEGLTLSLEKDLSKGLTKKVKRRAFKNLTIAALSLSIICGCGSIFLSSQENVLKERYNKAISLVEKYTGKKVRTFELANQNMTLAKTAISSSIKKKKLEESIEIGPIPFQTLSNWFTSFVSKDSMYAIEYKAIAKGAMLRCVFMGENAMAAAKEFEQGLLEQTTFLLDGEVEVEQKGDNVEVRLRVTT